MESSKKKRQANGLETMLEASARLGLYDDELDGILVRSKLQTMIRRGELVVPSAFAAQMGWSQRALSEALDSKRVFFVEVGNARYFPAFFASTERRQLQAVSKALGRLPGGAKLAFFLTRKGSLDRKTPLEALAKGQAAAVHAAAAGYAQPNIVTLLAMPDGADIEFDTD